MAEQAAAGPAGATKPSAEAPKRNVVLIALVAVNLLGLLGVGAYLLLSGSDESAEEDVAEGEEEVEEGEGEGHEREMGPLVQFESMVVNLRAPTTDRYLKLTFELELNELEQVEHVEMRMPAFRDAVLMHLTSLTIDDVQGADNALRLREQLLGMTDHTFGRDTVSHVYFTEYLVQ
jgi:flagellar FliL protein